MNVLSLFDGMSCGRIALERAGIKVSKYYACEIDKHAMRVSQANYPDIIHLGDVRGINAKDLLPKIDLLIGGSPCQGFSFAGKQLNFNDPRSALFFEFVRIWKEIEAINPSAKFLLENVRMKKEYEVIISQQLGIAPIMINSALVSAQNRVRLYWTNIYNKPMGIFGDVECLIPQPEDKGILLRDILEAEVDEKYFLSDKVVNNLLKYNENQIANNRGFSAKFRDAECVRKMDALKVGGGGKDDLVIDNSYLKIDRKGTPKANQDKASCLTVAGNSGGNHSDMDLIVASRGRLDDGKYIQEFEPRLDGKTNTITTAQKDNLVLLNDRQQRNFKEVDEKANTLLSTSWKGAQANGMALVNGSLTQIGYIGNANTQSHRVYDLTKSCCLQAGQGGLGVKTGLYLVKQINPSTESGGKQPYFQNRVYDSNGKSVALTQECARTNTLYQNRIRRLTPTECERLQTVPEGYTAHVSDTQRYRMLGNGWTVDVIVHILNFLNQ